MEIQEEEEEAPAAVGPLSWADLPDLAQQHVADHVLSIPDLLAFGAACRGSRALAKSVPLPALPPLLLRSFAAPDQAAYRDWPRNPRCHIQSVVPGPAAGRLFPSPMRPRIRRRLLGSSFGHLVFTYARRLFVSNIFTGEETRISPTMIGHRFINPALMTHCVLTAPFHSPACFLLITTHDSSILCHPWTGSAFSFRLEPPSLGHTQSCSVVRDRVFFMGRKGGLSVLDLRPRLDLQCLEVPAPDVVVTASESFNRRLVERDGDILLVLFAAAVEEMWRVRSIHVFRLDVGGSAWVPVGDIGEWCLFIDAVGTCPISCRDPGRWGGRRNCVYVSGPGCETWAVFPLDGSEIDPTDSPLDERFCRRICWPSAVWAYPSSLYSA